MPIYTIIENLWCRDRLFLLRLKFVQNIKLYMFMIASSINPTLSVNIIWHRKELPTYRHIFAKKWTKLVVISLFADGKDTYVVILLAVFELVQMFRSSTRNSVLQL